MLNDAKIATITEDEINEIARKYYEAKVANDKNTMNYYTTDLYLIATKNSILNRKMKSKIRNNSKLNDDPDTYIHDYFTRQLKYFNYEKSNSFVAFMMQFINQPIRKEIHKNAKMPTESLDDNGVNDDGDSLLNKYETTTAYNPFENIDEENVYILRSILPSMINKFYEHNKGKQASDKKYMYFKVFNTEWIVEFVEKSGDRYFNKAEAYESTDKDYIRFITYSDYESFDDILNFNYKKYSDILDEYNGEDKEVSIPCENKIISEYFFKTEKSETRPSEANVSIFRKKYMELLKTIIV